MATSSKRKCAAVVHDEAAKLHPNLSLELASITNARTVPSAVKRTWKIINGSSEKIARIMCVWLAWKWQKGD